MANELIPVSDEQAKAIQEVAKLGASGLETVREFAGFVAAVLGTPVSNIVGLLGLDWVYVKRAENLVRMRRAAEERLKVRHITDVAPVSLSLALPLLKAAAEEDREELVDLWARLIAAAMDPSRSGKVRQSYIDMISRLDPIDALVFNQVDGDYSYAPSQRNFIALRLSRSEDEIEISFDNLIAQGLAKIGKRTPGDADGVASNLNLSPRGREFKRLLSD